MPRAMRPAQHVGQLGFVDALQRHGIELDLQAGGECGIDTLHHLGKVAPARDGVEFFGIQRVEGDIDAPDAAIGQLAGIFCKLGAVGRQRQLFKRAALEMARQLAHQVHDVLAHQRLAAGQPQFLHALFDEDGAEPVQLFQRQEVLLGQEGHVLGHAVDAAEVAAVGDRDAQIADCAAERVDHVHQVALPGYWQAASFAAGVIYT